MKIENLNARKIEKLVQANKDMVGVVQSVNRRVDNASDLFRESRREIIYLQDMVCSFRKRIVALEKTQKEKVTA